MFWNKKTRKFLIAYSFDTVGGVGQGNIDITFSNCGKTYFKNDLLTDIAIKEIRKLIYKTEGFKNVCILNFMEIAYSEPKKPKNEKILV